jgi:hypothetical protein
MNRLLFALFVLAKDIDDAVDATPQHLIVKPKQKQQINKSLQCARCYDSQAIWDLWVATDSYDDLPIQPSDRRAPPIGDGN